MVAKLFINYGFFHLVLIACQGISDIPYNYGLSSCSKGLEDTNEISSYDPLLAYGRAFDIPISPDILPRLPALNPFPEAIHYLSEYPPPISLKRRKRSLNRNHKLTPQEYRLLNMAIWRPFTQKSVLSPELSPRKRSPRENLSLNEGDVPALPNFRSRDRVLDDPNLLSKSGTTPNQLVQAFSQDDDPRIHVNAGGTFTPRLGRSEGGEKVLDAGTGFFPRLGRSKGGQKVLDVDNGFIPRLGRAEERKRIILNAGSSFTPRLGRSEDEHQKIDLNAGGSFTPRLGRSDHRGDTKNIFAPESFYGRAIRQSFVQSFPPRLGRDEGFSRINVHAGSAFTPRLGRSENKISLNAGNGFTPRLGRSDESSRVNWDAGDTFIPRLGRALSKL